MHASIPRWIFVSAMTADSIQAKIVRQVTQSSILLPIVLSIFWSSTAVGQNSYLGTWNPQRKTDQILQPDDAHNRSLKPAGSFNKPQGHSVLEVEPDHRSSDWHPSSDSPNPNESQPKPFLTPALTPANGPVLIPDSPSEDSFTSLDVNLEASPVLSTGSEDRDAANQHTANQHTANQNAAHHQSFVQPATFEEPDQPMETFTGSAFAGSQLDGEAVDRACRWIDQYRVTSGPNPAGLNFQPVSLVELIRQPVATQLRSEMIVQYWETWSQWAELNSRIQFENWINNIRASGSQSDAQILSQSKSQAQNQILEARTFLGNAQARMQSFRLHTASSIDVLPPLPSDNPLIHPYVTNYKLYQNYRSMPVKFQNIDRELEDNLNLIVNQTNSVESAKSAAESQLKMYQAGHGNLNSAILAAQNWRSAETQLIRAVAQYNQKIADYALNVTEGKLAPETVAAMLIGKSGNKRALGISNSNASLNFRSPRQLSQTTHQSNDNQAPLGGFSARPTSDRNDFGGGDSSRISGLSNSSEMNQPMRNSNAKAAGDFSPSIHPPSDNPTNPGSFSPAPPASAASAASSASGQFNPLAPLPKSSVRGADRQTKSEIQFSAPDSEKFDRVKSSGGDSISPPPNGSTRPTGERPSRTAESNPSNGEFSPPSFNPQSFNPQSRSADRAANRGSFPEVDDAGLLDESTESEAGSILPPENGGSDPQQDPNR